MKRLATLSILCALSSVSFAQGEDPALRNAAQKFYTHWDSLMAKMDAKGMWELFHPAYTMVDVNGKSHTLKDMKAQFQSMVGNVKDVKSKISVDHVGGTAQELLTWGTMKMSFKMKQGSKWVTMNFTEKFAETLVMTPSGYKLIYSQALP